MKGGNSNYIARFPWGKIYRIAIFAGRKSTINIHFYRGGWLGENATIQHQSPTSHSEIRTRNIRIIRSLRRGFNSCATRAIKHMYTIVACVQNVKYVEIRLFIQVC
jgi:hypothetical protein